MTIVSIDPAYAKTHAISVFYDGMLDHSFRSSSLEVIMGAIRISDKVYIEDQYFSRNVDVLKKLARATGELIALCKLEDKAYELVPPAIWQKHFSLYGKKPIGIKEHKWQKVKEKMLVEKAQEYEYIGEDPDISASILIGVWGIERES